MVVVDWPAVLVLVRCVGGRRVVVVCSYLVVVVVPVWALLIRWLCPPVLFARSTQDSCVGVRTCVCLRMYVC